MQGTHKTKTWGKHGIGLRLEVGNRQLRQSSVRQYRESQSKLYRGFSGGPGVENGLPLQGTQVQALVQEDATCLGDS